MFFVNVTIPYDQFETCVKPDVDRVATCAWCRIYTKYHELYWMC
jgi:hypothetical protein